MRDRDALTQSYPWLARHDAPERLIMGDDLDAALSTVLYLHTHPRAELVGVYRGYERVTFAAQCDWAALLGGLWLDLDIYDARCRSLGHHIVRHTAEDVLPGFANSCNLNELYGRSVTRHFRWKYPLGTVHFLMWLYGCDVRPQTDAELLIWLADSTYINGQSHRFRRNVEAWLREVVPLPGLLAGFAALDAPAFEARMSAFQERLAGRGFAPGKGQVRSRHLGLSGFQCQPGPEDDPVLYLRKLLLYCANVTGWHFNLQQLDGFRPPVQELVGRRRRCAVHTLGDDGLAAFLERERVFSYVFTHRQTLNYTQDLG